MGKEISKARASLPEKNSDISESERSVRVRDQREISERERERDQWERQRSDIYERLIFFAQNSIIVFELNTNQKYINMLNSSLVQQTNKQRKWNQKVTRF